MKLLAAELVVDGREMCLGGKLSEFRDGAKLSIMIPWVLAYGMGWMKVKFTDKRTWEDNQPSEIQYRNDPEVTGVS
jgi:hypothetical protein